MESTESRYALSELRSVTDASKELGIQERQVRALIAQFSLGRRIGRDYVLTPDDINYLKSRPAEGRRHSGFSKDDVVFLTAAIADLGARQEFTSVDLVNHIANFSSPSMKQLNVRPLSLALTVKAMNSMQQRLMVEGVRLTVLQRAQATASQTSSAST